MNTKWMDPYERVALLEQVLEDIEEREAARIHEQSRKLSLEDCVYWLVLLREPGPAYWATVGNAQFVENDGRAYANYAKHRGCSFPSTGAHSRARARKNIVLARLCFEAAKRIREAKR